jgi:hypothetical protein
MKQQRLGFWVAAAVIILGLLTGPAWAAKGSRSGGGAQQQPAAGGIPENKQPWKGLPWVIGGVLSAGAIAVGAKNAKRTHLD